MYKKCVLFILMTVVPGLACAGIPSTAYVRDYFEDNQLSAGTNTTVSNGKINVATANGTTLGVVKAGTNTTITSGAVNVATANGTTLGVVKAGTNTTISSGAVNVATGSPSTLGVVKVGQIPSGSATSTTYATIWVE